MIRWKPRRAAETHNIVRYAAIGTIVLVLITSLVVMHATMAKGAHP
jgi:hypothetical protein